MDRRQVLLGMTAMGLAGPFNVSPLLNAQSVETNSPVSKTEHQKLTDREQAGLRGPVKTCVEETAGYREKSVETTEYSLNGDFLSSRHERNGQLLYSRSESDWLETEVLDSKGRLVKKVYGQRGEPAAENLYSYDDEGRLLTLTISEHFRFEYHYQADGGKISVQTFNPKMLERTRDSSYVGSAFDAPRAGIGVPTGGSVTTIYDSGDRPTEMLVRSADGQLVTRFVRTYDAQGRVTEEKPLQQNLALLMIDRMSPEERASMSPEQIQELSEFVLAQTATWTTFTYDAQGRITEKCERDLLGETKTTTLYNEQGDKAHELTTVKNNREVPIEIRQGSDLRYTYQYDSYGNWTKQTETSAGGSSVVTSRMLTYY